MTGVVRVPYVTSTQFAVMIGPMADERAASSAIQGAPAEDERTATELSELVESFEEYYRRDYRQLVGLAFVLTGSSNAAEDVCQEALTAAHRNWGKVAHYDDPGAWVRRVIVNRSRSRFRRLRSETKALTRIGNRRSPVAEPAERSLEVWAAVRRLPPRQAQSIALLYWEDRSIAEIAEILDCGTETVKTHLKRGRAALASALVGFDERNRSE